MVGIEKKFIVKRLPKHLNFSNETFIEQNYIVTGKEEIRIRKTINEHNTTFKLTIKKDEGLVKYEKEINISEETYDQLNKNVPIIKKRKQIEYYNNVIIIDFYLNDIMKNLVIAKVLFKNKNEIDNFIYPDWLGTDITKNQFYKNQNIWDKLQGKKK